MFLSPKVYLECAERKEKEKMNRKNQDENSPSSHTGYKSAGGVETKKSSTLLVKRKRDDQIQKSKFKPKEVPVRPEMQWWGFSEMLDINPKSGGAETMLDNSRPGALAGQKPVTPFKKGRKAMKTRPFVWIMLFAAVSLFSFSSAQAAAASSRTYACEEDLIEVMFTQNSKVRMRGDQLIDLSTDALAGLDRVLVKSTLAQWQRMCDVPEERLDEIHSQGEASTGKALYNLNNIYRLRIGKDSDVWKLSRELEALSGIIYARPVPKPVACPWPPPLYESQQGYLDSATATPTGIDAEYAWKQPGGNGFGVTVCDLEYGWKNHTDISKLSGSQINPYSFYWPANADTFHGTAVAGEMVSDSNYYGTSGICFGASLKTCATYYGSPSWNVAGAMGMAIAALSQGDVMLIEQQWDYSDPNTAHPDLIPIEWWGAVHPDTQSYNPVYAAIENAIAGGIHVVECGGNGGAPTAMIGYNTDNLTWYGNSGAIIVGAGGAYTGGTYPEGDLEKLNFSSYGSRFDLQGWGENVVTTGYGNLYSADGVNYYYTNSFSGTSSAAAVVAGAVACCVGFAKTQGWGASTLTPSFIRDVLVTTGTPQVNPGTGHIGPRPDLRAAFASLGAFADVTSGPLGDMDGSGFGVAWGDYDNDGDQDVYLACPGNPNHLLRNDGGGAFTDVTGTAGSGLGDNGYTYGTAWGDYDNDGDLDLYIAKSNTYNVLFTNNGNGTLGYAGATMPDSRSSVCVGWADYDNDGFLDMYVTNTGDYSNRNTLYHNEGGVAFADSTSAPVGNTDYGSGMAWGDYDNDGDMDLYLVNDGQANKLFRNDGGVFVDVTAWPLNDAGQGKTADWGDYDNDGDLDLYLGNTMGNNKLFRNNGGGSFSDATPVVLANLWGTYAASWADYDNDGDLDLFAGDWGAKSRLFRNDGGGTFVDATGGVLTKTYWCYGAAWADYDKDGDLDLFLGNAQGQSNALLQNQVGSGNHWLHINLVGTVSNKTAIGARARLVAGGVSQIREVSSGSAYCSQNSLTVEFGLGSATLVDSLVIRWPSGMADTLTSLAVDRVMTIYEGGSALRGDANGDGVVDLGDAIYLLNYLYKGGPAPNPSWTGDANSDGVVDLGDAIYLLNYLYKGGPPPASGKAGNSPANVSRLTSGSGHAEVTLVLDGDSENPDLPSLAKAAPQGLDGISQISVMAEFDQDVAGVHLEIEFDPDRVRLLNPSPTQLAAGLQLFSDLEPGVQTIGMVDLSGKNVLTAGSGDLVRLQAVGDDLSSVRIKHAMLFDRDGMRLSVQTTGELKMESAKEPESKPQDFHLAQNYPNPFNPQTSISYALPQDGHAKLVIYNIVGQRVRTLVDEYQPAGYKTVLWDGLDENGDQVASGVYFYKLQADESCAVKKMLLMK